VAELRIRNIDDWVVATFRSRARRRGHSLTDELKDALREAALLPKRQMAAEHKELLDRLKKKYGTFSDSAQLIRDMRDERG
jgi:plasmid stability protein